MCNFPALKSVSLCARVGLLVFSAVAGAQTFDVYQFGAKGDGVTLDTVPIQRAVDAAAAAGGGTVVIPRGTVKSGTIYLKSHVEFRVEMGARLLGSDNLDDYNSLDAFPQNTHMVKAEGWQGKHLILALEAEDVVLSGEGTIDANGRAFFDRSKFWCKSKIQWRFGGYNVTDVEKCLRPGQVIEFCECRNVRVKDLRFVDSTAWTCFFHGCENVQVRGIAVMNDVHNMNTDGVDIDCCRNVTVSDCVFETGDDAVAIRGCPDRLKDPSKACENITVANCTAKVSACGVRIGVGGGIIRHVAISNFIVQQAEQGFCIQSVYGSLRGVEISDVAIANSSVRNAVYAIWIQGDKGKRPRDIRFSNVRVFPDDTVEGDDVHVRDADGVTFENCPGAQI